MSHLLHYETLSNIRDLGGTKTVEGLVIRNGKLIRSNHLYQISDHDISELSKLVDTVVDFRSDKERNEKPDTTITGVTYIANPIFDDIARGITRDEEADQLSIMDYIDDPIGAKEQMCKMYSSFVINETARSRFSKFIHLLMEPHEKAVLWHCTAGKDRAGTGAAIIEGILRVSREETMKDYLSTNRYIHDEVESIRDLINHEFHPEVPVSDEVMNCLFGALPEYLESFYQAVNDTYGSFDQFVSDGLQVSKSEIELLKHRYLKQD